MTEATTQPVEGIAARIRQAAEGPRSPMLDLSAQARQLRSSIAVLEKWMAAAMEDRSAELITLAENTHDQVEEELARVMWEREFERRSYEYRDGGREVPEEVVHYSLLSDTLLAAYCVLSSAPEDIFGIAGGDVSNEMKRFSMMGALLVAQEAAEREVKRAEPKPKP